MVKLVLDYSNVRDANFACKTLGMVHGLTGNGHFPLPWPAEFPSLAAFTAKQKAFADGLAAAADRDKGKVATKNTLRTELQAMVRELGRYLQVKSGGDRTILESTGYDLAKSRVATPPIPDAPQNLKVGPGKETGWVLVRATRSRGARMFEVEYCVGDRSVPANWKIGAQTGTCRKVEIGGLERGKDYAFRMRAFGREGHGPWSNVVVYMPN
ncbi:MAG: fibronectin type III domain-containing protein [Verrucomicrobiota bacterium]